MGCGDCAPCVLVQIREYEKVIIEDRMEKEKTRKKLEQDDLELKSIVKVGCAGSWVGMAGTLQLCSTQRAYIQFTVLRHKRANLAPDMGRGDQWKQSLFPAITI